MATRSIATYWTSRQTLKVVVFDTTKKAILDPSKKLIFKKIWQISNSIDLTRSAHIKGDVIHAPFARIQDDSALFNIELADTSTSPYQFTLQAEVAQNSDLQPSNSCSFSSNILTLNNLVFDEASYTVNLQLQMKILAILFELLSATAN